VSELALVGSTGTGKRMQKHAPFGCMLNSGKMTGFNYFFDRLRTATSAR